MTSDPELINKYKQRAIVNNTIQQTSFSSMSINGTELKGGTNLVSKQTQITHRRKRTESIVIKGGVVFLFIKSEQNLVKLYVAGHQPNPELVYEINPLVESLSTTRKIFRAEVDSIFYVSRHDFVLNTPVSISDITTNPINTVTGLGGIYYVRDVTQGSFKLSRTINGAAITVLYPCEGLVGINSRLSPSLNTAAITKTADGFKVHFITQPIEDTNALDFYVYSNGTIHKSRFTLPDNDFFNAPIISAIIAGDGSFSVRGTYAQIPQGVIQYTEYFDYGYRNARLLDAHGAASNANPYNGGQFPESNPNYVAPLYSIMTQSKQALAYVNQPDGALGILIGVRESVMFYTTVNSSLVYSSNFLLPITPVKFISFRQGFSVLIRPESNIANTIRFDNYPNTSRILRIDFTKDESSKDFKLLQLPDTSLAITPSSYVITEITDRILYLNTSEAYYVRQRSDSMYEYFLWDGVERILSGASISNGDPDTASGNFIDGNMYKFTTDSVDLSKGVVNIDNLISGSTDEQDVNYSEVSEILRTTTVDVASFI